MQTLDGTTLLEILQILIPVIISFIASSGFWLFIGNKKEIVSESNQIKSVICGAKKEKRGIAIRKPRCILRGSTIILTASASSLIPHNPCVVTSCNLTPFSTHPALINVL